MTALLVDASHHNAVLDPAALRRGGVTGVVLKATEGAGFADPTFAARRDACHAAGLAVGVYHFARLGDPAAEAAFFAAAVGVLRPGEFVGLDMEVSAPGVDIVAWSAAWLDALASRMGGEVRLEYLNKAELAAHDWGPVVARGVRLWLADYDGRQVVVPSGSWPALTLKQYTAAGQVGGFTGDLDWAPGDLTTLTSLTEDDMTPEQDARLKNVETILGGLQNAVGDPKIGVLTVVNDVDTRVRQMQSALPPQPAAVDAGAVAAALAADTGFLAALAAAVVSQAGARMQVPVQ